MTRKRKILKTLVLFALVMSACSEPSETVSSDTGSGGTSGAPQAGSSGSAGSPASCPGAVSYTPKSYQPIDSGTVVSEAGFRYLAKVRIEYQSPECAPTVSAQWCADWFAPLGPCR